MTANSKNPGPLVDRQHEKFAQGLAELRTQEDAYKAAGYVPDSGNATRLAARPEIKARVAELMAEAAEFANVRRERIVVELDRTARANILDFYDFRVVEGELTAKIKDLSRLPREVTAAIQSIETDKRSGAIKLKLHDRNAANTTLLRFLGGLPEAPAVPSFNIFNVLSSDDQRALADILENMADDEAAAAMH